MGKSIAKYYKDFPAHPVYVNVEYSDGDPSRWPRNTVEYFENNGSVNWMKPVDLDEPVSQKWRHSIGRAIAVRLGVTDEDQLSRSVLERWPQGYGFFDHHKGPQGRERHDLYLFGSPATVKFRSSPEFIPHAIWLLDKMQGTCGCKYCSGNKSQQQVTAKLSSEGYYRRASASPSPSAPMRKLKGGIALRSKRPKDSKTYAAVQRQPSTVATSIHVSEQPMVADRKSDVDAMTSRHDQAQRRWFRKHEVVWVHLNKPIANGTETVISFWPGVIRDHCFRPVAHPAQNADTPWTVEQNWTYKINLCAILRDVTVTGNQIIPWLSYIPRLASTGVDSLSEEELSETELLKLDPMSDPPPPFAQVVSRWMLACNISNHVGLLYCVTDHFDFEYQLHGARSKPSIPLPLPTPSSSSLVDSLNSATQSNADAMIVGTGPSRAMPPPQPVSTHGNVSAPLASGGTTSTQVASATLGKVPSAGHRIKQDRFQGLWWGSERIWVDDFVRIKLHRRSLAPEGAAHILPPAGPSKKTLERYNTFEHTEGSPPDAGSRGLFMQLNALFIADVVSLDGRPVKECRASGVLYELADEDWEEGILPFTPTVSHSRKPVAKLSSTHISASSPPSVGAAATSLRNPKAGDKAAYPASGQTFHLPPAPKGYKFRPILKDGYEAILSLSLLAGRYYPSILRHPLLQPNWTKILNQPASFQDHLWALEGLCINFGEEIEPLKCKSRRDKMLEDAANRARLEFLQNIRDLAMEEDDLKMEVDL